METYKTKLRELLKTIPEIKSDLEELRLGTKVIVYDKDEYEYGIEAPNGEIYDLIDGEDFLFGGEVLCIYESNFDYKIIGNPIHRRHLEWFCERKEIFIFLTGGNIILNYMFKELRIKLNNKKPLEEQTEETLGEIYNFLKKTLEK